MKEFLVLVLAIGAIEATDIGFTWEKCHVTDQPCLKKLLTTICHGLSGGNEELHTNPLDPLIVPSLMMDVPDTDWKYEFRNMTVVGMADTSLDDFNIDVPNRKMTVQDSFHLDVMATLVVNIAGPNSRTLELTGRGNLHRLLVDVVLPLKFRHNDQKDVFMDMQKPEVKVKVVEHPDVKLTEESLKILKEDPKIAVAIRQNYDLFSAKIMERAMEVLIQDLKEFATKVPVTEYFIFDQPIDFKPDE